MNQDFQALVPPFGALDWILLALVGASLLIGAWRGLVFEVFSLLAWVVAFVVAQWFAGAAAAWLPMGDTSESVRYAAGFVVVFLVAIFACHLVAALVKKLVEAVGLRPVDRVLGALFGVVRACVLVLVLGVVAQLTPLGKADWWTQSISGPLIASTVRSLKPALPDEIGRLLSA